MQNNFARICSVLKHVRFLTAFVLLVLLTACQGPGPAPRSIYQNDVQDRQRNTNTDIKNTSSKTEASDSLGHNRAHPSIPDEPLSLSQAIRIGTARNPDVKTAVQRIQIARARLSQAEAAFYPQLSAGLSYTRTNHPAQGFFMTVAQREFDPRANVNDPGVNENYRTEVTLRYPIFRGGRDLNRAAAAEKRVRARDARRDAVENQLVYTITEAYLSILSARQQRVIAEKSLSTVRAERDRVRKQADRGAALESDVQSLNVRLSDARRKKIRARNAIEQARVALKTLLADASDRTVKIEKRGPESVGRSTPPRDDAIQAALSQRPEFESARYRVEALRKRLEAVKGERYPVLQTFGTYGHDNDAIEYTDQKDSWAAGIELEYKLFTGFSTREKLREARHALREARMQLKKTRLMIRKEVEKALIRVDNRLAELEVTEESVNSAREALRIVERQYEEGAVPVTRYLETETDLTRSRSKQKAALYGVRKAQANLDRALGNNLTEHETQEQNQEAN
jgi:outer membrane protein